MSTMSYDDRLNLLGLDRLELRRLCTDLITCYKIINNIVVVPFYAFFKFAATNNAVYSKIGHFASEEVVLNLLNTKCISSMLYGTEACPVMSRHKHSFDFTVTLVFMKILHTNSKSVVEECMGYFGFLPMSHHIVNRTVRFLDRFISSDNMLCSLFKEEAQRHKNTL